MSVMAEAIESPGWACCLPEIIPLSLRLRYLELLREGQKPFETSAEQSYFSNLVGKYPFHLLLCGFVIRRSWSVSATSELALLFRKITIILRMKSSSSECE